MRHIPAIAPAEIRIVHEGERFVVVDKPANALSVPGARPGREDCVAARVRARYPRAQGPLVVHRLDMETSGLMVLALDPDAHRGLSRQFAERRVDKGYVAVVAGRVEGDAGTVDLPLRLDVGNRPYQVVDHQHGRAALTRWRVLERDEGATRIAFFPQTGRTHQLRLHAACPVTRGGLGCPIL
ncbi:MAG: RluA family pseudouridine synthase, partial [Myxococcota bacterium]|nr:RluA family pseudouridine synthase [Myxococcota bacterium]